MRSLSDQFLLILPALLGLVLLFMFGAPMRVSGWSLAPNVAWVATLVIAFAYPPAWPRWFAFALGLLQDVVFATPLGSQALLTLLLALLVDSQIRRQVGQPFLIRWAEAAGVLVVWHILLWALMSFVSADAPSVLVVLRGAVVSALWYPMFYVVFGRLAVAASPR